MMARCSRCRRRPCRRGGRWCLVCHAASQRAYCHRRGPLYGEARRRALARATANVYLRRGKLTRQPCTDCGATHDALPVQMHHEDYSRPLDVTWLCTQCHQDRHNDERAAA